MSYDDYRRDTLVDFIDSTYLALNEKRQHFDSVACRGVSGLMVASPVAHMLGKSIVVVRKSDERSHSADTVTNLGEIGSRYLVVDDFIATGATVRIIRETIVDAIDEHNDDHWNPMPQAEYAGAFLYSAGRWDGFTPRGEAVKPLARKPKVEPKSVAPTPTPAPLTAIDGKYSMYFEMDAPIDISSYTKAWNALNPNRRVHIR